MSRPRAPSPCTNSKCSRVDKSLQNKSHSTNHLHAFKTGTRLPPASAELSSNKTADSSLKSWSINGSLQTKSRQGAGHAYLVVPLRLQRKWLGYACAFSRDLCNLELVGGLLVPVVANLQSTTETMPLGLTDTAMALGCLKCFGCERQTVAIPSVPREGAVWPPPHSCLDGASHGIGGVPASVQSLPTTPGLFSK